MGRTTAEWDDIFCREQTVAGGVRDLLEVIATGQPEARGLFSQVSSNVGEFQVTNADGCFCGSTWAVKEFRADSYLAG